MRIAVFGASGRIGQMMRSVPCPDEVKMTWVSRMPPPGSDWRQWSPDEAVDLDWLHDVDTVLVLAGATPTRGEVFEKAEMMQANVDLSLVLHESAARAGVERVLLASSAAVYGRQADPNALIAETTDCHPETDYGYSKLAMERAVAAQVAQLGPQSPATTCLRIATVAGADMLLQNAANATETAPLTLDCFADGRGPERSYIGPNALAAVLLALCTTPEDLPFLLNIAAPGAVQMDALLNSFGPDGAPIPWTFRPAPKAALRRVVLDTARLEALHLAPPRADAASIAQEARAILCRVQPENEE
ncbi:NAD-dependent epimerase/dehydratase family protein [Gymnodinialimonas hymeniacidonis]|uniref:NAD-dependent epimerase/dehydratase family protein n=1 Tax=Gymnodinialimonas hymeniacidonis TaxID=3126508 RepID=UPI0034C688D3